VNYSNKDIRFKQQFKQLNYYSMPKSILFVLRKRLNLIFNVLALILFAFYSLL